MNKMNSRTIILIVIGAILLIGGCGGCTTYNTLIAERENVNQSWSEVQNQYKRRFDLIDQLVNTVKGAAKFENETFVKLAEARARAFTAGAVDPNKLTESQLKELLQAQAQYQNQARLMIQAVQENYPTLNATKNFSDLQAQIEGTENRIAVARQNFNKAAQSYNVKQKTFPTNLFANMFGFTPRPYFEATDEETKKPEIKF